MCNSSSWLHLFYFYLPDGTPTHVLNHLTRLEIHISYFCDLAEANCKAEVPADIAEALALGRMTALSKPGNRVRGIVTGCTFRRVTARALARQFASELERATAPFQFAL